MSVVPLQGPRSATPIHPHPPAGLEPLVQGYRGTSPARKRTPLGPYRRPMPKVLLGGSDGGGHVLMSEVPLYRARQEAHPPLPL